MPSIADRALLALRETLYTFVDDEHMLLDPMVTEMIERLENKQLLAMTLNREQQDHALCVLKETLSKFILDEDLPLYDNMLTEMIGRLAGFGKEDEKLLRTRVKKDELETIGSKNLIVVCPDRLYCVVCRTYDGTCLGCTEIMDNLYARASTPAMKATGVHFECEEDNGFRLVWNSDSLSFEFVYDWRGADKVPYLDAFYLSGPHSLSAALNELHYASSSEMREAGQGCVMFSETVDVVVPDVGWEAIKSAEQLLGII